MKYRVTFKPKDDVPLLAGMDDLETFQIVVKVKPPNTTRALRKAGKWLRKRGWRNHYSIAECIQEKKSSHATSITKTI